MNPFSSSPAHSAGAETILFSSFHTISKVLKNSRPATKESLQALFLSNTESQTKCKIGKFYARLDRIRFLFIIHQSPIPRNTPFIEFFFSLNTKKSPGRLFSARTGRFPISYVFSIILILSYSISACPMTISFIITEPFSTDFPPLMTTLHSPF